MGCVEILPHGGRVAAEFLDLLDDPRHGAVAWSAACVCTLFSVAICGGSSASKLRHDRVDIVQIRREFRSNCSADLVSRRPCFVCGPQRLANGDVIAVRFPIEIIAEGLKKSSKSARWSRTSVGGVHHFLRDADRMLSGVGKLLHECVRALHASRCVPVSSSACLRISSSRSFTNGRFCSCPEF